MVEHDAGAIDLIDLLMPDLEFDEPDEFALLQARNADSRRATYGINGAAQGVQVSGSKPINSRSRPSKTDETTSYNKPVANVSIHSSSVDCSLLPVGNRHERFIELGQEVLGLLLIVAGR